MGGGGGGVHIARYCSSMSGCLQVRGEEGGVRSRVRIAHRCTSMPGGLQGASGHGGPGGLQGASGPEVCRGPADKGGQRVTAKSCMG